MPSKELIPQTKAIREGYALEKASNFRYSCAASSLSSKSLSIF